MWGTPELLYSATAIYLGFDFGYKRIGVAVGQGVSASAQPLKRLEAKAGVPDWGLIEKLILAWKPAALIVGLPRCIDDTPQYTTHAAKRFAKSLRQKFSLPVELVDERLSTVEAREYLFSQGGYRNIMKTEVDSIAACIILEQWLKQFATE